jgi:hypothetical protein
MKLGTLRYDHPNHLVHREHSISPSAGATTVSGKMRNFMAMRLKAAHATVTTAGTAAGHGYDVYSGTTSIGTIPLSTNTAGYTVSVDLLNAAVAKGDTMEIRSLADATGVADVVLEYTADAQAEITINDS